MNLYSIKQNITLSVQPDSQRLVLFVTRFFGSHLSLSLAGIKTTIDTGTHLLDSMSERVHIFTLVY